MIANIFLRLTMVPVKSSKRWFALENPYKLIRLGKMVSFTKQSRKLKKSPLNDHGTCKESEALIYAKFRSEK